MNPRKISEPKAVPRQRFKNGEVHDWYRTVWGYSDHLVSNLLEEFAGKPGSRVLDPFCGTGTTLVECMKRGFDSAGVDANPVSCLAARVKTNWRISQERLIDLLIPLRRDFRKRLRQGCFRCDPTYRYIEDTGMLRRGWICEGPLRQSVGLKQAINGLRTSWQYKQALTLALLDTVVRTAANVKFGPELYCGRKKVEVDVFADFERRIHRMARDLAVAKSTSNGEAIIVEGDARACGVLRPQLGRRKFSLVICSPPYPAEHDYTRNSRLELAFLESVVDRDSLRNIKKRMVRSHTKGIYSQDSDSSHVEGDEFIKPIVDRIDAKALKKTHGFAKLYSKVTTEYFGGMKRHLVSMSQLLSKNAVLAYVVGDQSSYLQVPISTAMILSEIANGSGYETVEIRHWRDRQSTVTSKAISENILILRRSGKQSHA